MSIMCTLLITKLAIPSDFPKEFVVPSKEMFFPLLRLSNLIHYLFPFTKIKIKLNSVMLKYIQIRFCNTQLGVSTMGPRMIYNIYPCQVPNLTTEPQNQSPSKLGTHLIDHKIIKGEVEKTLANLDSNFRPTAM